MNSWYLGTMLYLIASFSWAAFYAYACEKEGYAASSLVLVLLGLLWPVTLPLSFAIALYQIVAKTRPKSAEWMPRESFNEWYAEHERTACEETVTEFEKWSGVGYTTEDTFTPEQAEARAEYQMKKMTGAAGLDLPKPPMARFDAGWAASDVEAYLQGYAEVADALADAEKWYDVSDDPEEREKFWYDK